MGVLPRGSPNADFAVSNSGRGAGHGAQGVQARNGVSRPHQPHDRGIGCGLAGAEAHQSRRAEQELGIMPKDAVLSRHDPDVRDWDKLPTDERKLYARMMEVFAGYCQDMDHQVGRLLDLLEQVGEIDRTVMMMISDNGASAEGGPTGSVNENKVFNNAPDDLKQNLAALNDLGGPKYFNHYAWGWTFAGNTPFRRWKRETYRAGVSDPFLVHWPKGSRRTPKSARNSPTPSTWSRPCSRRRSIRPRRSAASPNRRFRA
jgi:arylsulfatase A-like enzyme